MFKGFRVWLLKELDVRLRIPKVVKDDRVCRKDNKRKSYEKYSELVVNRDTEKIVSVKQSV